MRNTKIIEWILRIAVAGEFPSHGAYFDVSSDREFVLFGDGNDSKSYDPGPGVNIFDCGNVDNLECLEVFKIQGAVHFSARKGCYGINDCEDVSNLNIVFRRPYPDAIITSISDNGNITTYSFAKIILKSTLDDIAGERQVIVWNTGQIVVKKVIDEE